MAPDPSALPWCDIQAGHSELIVGPEFKAEIASSNFGIFGIAINGVFCGEVCDTLAGAKQRAEQLLHDQMREALRALRKPV